MRTSLRRFSLRRSLTAAALGLCVVLPGYGVASGVAGSVDPAVMVPVAPLSQAEEGVRFTNIPDPISYRFINSGKETESSFAFDVSGFTDNMAVRIQLTDKSNTNGIKIGSWANGSEVWPELSDGGCWVPNDAVVPNNINVRLKSSKVCDVDYTVSIYASKDMTTEPLATISRTVRYMDSENKPNIENLERISGELNTDIPFSFNISKAGFLEGQPAQIKIRFDSFYGLSLLGKDLQQESDYCYVLSVPSFSATQYTLTVRAAEVCGGSYSIQVFDADGNNVDYAKGALYSIPMEYSSEDIDALKAIAAANPLSNDLQNFIANKEYLNDREQSDNYSVGVTWNTETPSRVKSFFIYDGKTRTVSTLDLSALIGLESVNVQGSRLESLDLSTLTNLNNVNLYNNNSLTWFTVKLPNPLPFSMYGSTQVMAGTPVDDYISYATSGTEIDLSTYAEVDGVKSTYQWYRVVRDLSVSRTEVDMEAVAGKEGTFIFKGTPGEYYQCEISNANRGNWRMKTPEIKVTRGSDNYSPIDIAALKKLAADNPNVTQLQEFVDSKGWEHENWNAREDVIATDWSEGEIARLTHLRILLDWNSRENKISSLDLSAFAELKYFECERFMDIDKLDLSKNTKLEHLHVFSVNLASLDLSNCQNLRYFRFGTQRLGEGTYVETKFNTVNLNGCTQLEELYLEHSSMALLDISAFKQLRRLEVEFCPNLKIQGFENASKLEYLALPNTNQFADLLNNLPSSILYLDLSDTEYALPSVEVAKNLLTLGVPSNVESFDMAQYPNLTSWELGYVNHSSLRYSALKNYRSNVKYSGISYYELNSSLRPGSDLFENGDTIDLSSEAEVNGVKSVFLWVNSKYGTEEKEALKPVPGRPGVFILDSKEEKYGSYYCRIMNPLFSTIMEINRYNGWSITTSQIRVETSTPQIFAESDVATLARIVEASNSEELKEWWNSGLWQKEDTIVGSMLLVWNQENPRRLTQLHLYGMDDSFAKEMDLSTLDKLEYLLLVYSQVEKLTLPKNNKVLHSLMLNDNKTLKSLIVSEYPSLKRLNVESTGLTALDLSNNKNLTDLNLNWTMIPEVDAETAARLQGYGVPMTTTSIDLAKFPALQNLYTFGSELEFSGVLNPRQLDHVFGSKKIVLGEAYPAHSAYGETVDLSKRIAVSGSDSKVVWILNGEKLEHEGAKFTITEALNPNDQLVAKVTNPLFSDWTIHYETTVYTCDGDANLDKQVNVQDVTATVSYILKDEENMIENFGYAEADVNYDQRIEIADVIGIVNIIRDQPVTKAGMLRAETEAPVLVELDTDNFLTISSQVPVAGIYLELVGATEDLPLVGEAAKFLQASHLSGDTLRVIGYSLDGRTIPPGKTRILRMSVGVTLVGASFSDAKANSLKSAGDAIVTSNAPIEAIERLDAVFNYPNPFRGSTTFRYQLVEPADAVTIHVFSTNGALAAILNGLPGEVGENRHTAALTLPAGVYYYRLTAKAGRGVKASNTNILIIK